MKTPAYFIQNLNYKVFILFSLISILFVNLQAQSYTFTGNGDGTTWTDPANWNLNSVPYVDDFTCDVTIPTGFSVTIPVGEELTLESGALAGNSTTPSTIINNGTFNFAFVNTTSFISGLVFENNNLLNFETATDTYTSAQVYKVTINNNLQGIMNINGVRIDNNGGTNPINNFGKIQKSGEQTIALDTEFNNDGEVEVIEGDFSLSWTNVLRSGTFNVANGSSLIINSSSTTISGTWDGMINGSFDIRGNLTISPDTSVTVNLEGNGLTMHSNMIFGGGTFINHAMFNVNTDTANKSLSGITFENNGMMNLGNGTDFTSNVQLSNCTLINKPTGEIHLNGTMFNYDWGVNSIENQGLFKKEGDFTENLNVPMTNSGTIESSGGNFNFISTLHNSETSRIEGENLQFLGNGNFTNQGTVSPGLSVGTMNVAGFFEIVNGVLEVDINGNSDYDVLNYTGTTAQNISGDIVLNLNYAPTLNQEFTIFNCPSANLNASFPSTVEAHFEDALYRFDVITDSNSITLRLSEILGSEDVLVLNKISIYPNPVQTLLHVESDKIIESIEIIGLDGKTLNKQSFHEKKVEINVDHLPKGVYVVRIQSGEIVEQKKMIKK